MRTPLSVFSLALLLAASLPAQDISKPLTPVLQPLVDNHQVAGLVVLVADRDKVLDHEAIGFSSLTTKTPMRPDALFWIASMTKSITGAAFMMLVDEGKVSLTDPVEKYLPEFKGQQVAGPDAKAPAHAPVHPIKVNEILSHTSGLVRAGDAPYKAGMSLKDVVAGYAARPLIREPGTKYEYNNSGIATAGRIIEVLSGMSYADFVQKRLFDPLGMKDSIFWPTAEQASRLGHTARLTPDKKNLEDLDFASKITPDLIARLGKGVSVPREILADYGHGKLSEYADRYADPAGGLFSTAADVSRFCQMLLNGGTWQGKRLLSEAALRQMITNQTEAIPFSPDEGYGIGVSLKLKNNEGPAAGSFGHRGARRTSMWIDPANGLAMVLMVAHFEMPGDVQKQMYSSFMQTAITKYGRPSR